jgi:hypothetical protein
MNRALPLALAGLLAAALSTVAFDPGIASASDTGGPVIAAVGDMACDSSDPGFHGGAGTSTKCAEAKVSKSVRDDTSVVRVLGLGDFQYYCSDLDDWQKSYDPTWGSLDNLMDPAPGNHEYQRGKDPYGSTCPSSNATAQNYFQHFGAAAHSGSYGHYSFNLGSWHIISLNANCGHRGAACSATSAQTKWLNTDLAHINRGSTPCVLAFWHQPLFTGQGTGMNKKYTPWWNSLYSAHADVVLNGHVHNYQRFAPAKPSGGSDAQNGITEYVVGTGGENLTSLKSSARPQPVTYKKTFGYLRMTLLSGGWDADFISSTGQRLDSSAGSCHE